MHKLILAAVAAVVFIAPIANSAMAEDSTTIIKKDDGDTSKTVIKKKDDTGVVPLQHSDEKKVIIHKDGDHDD